MAAIKPVTRRKKNYRLEKKNANKHYKRQSVGKQGYNELDNRPKGYQ